MSAAPEPVVSVIIVSFNTKDLLAKCIRTFREHADGVPHEIIVVDNASRDGSADMVERDFPDLRLIRTGANLGFAGGNNPGFKVARGRYVLLLNSDAFVSPGALSTSVRKMDADPRIGGGGARLLSADGSWQPAARMFPSILNDFLILSGLSNRFPKSRFFGRPDRTWADPSEPASVDWVPGAYFFLRKEALDKVGIFDERFFLYFEEVDLCLRIKQAGYTIAYWPDVAVTHLGGESSKSVPDVMMSKSGAQLTLWRMRSQLLYYRKHHGALGAALSRALEKGWHSLRAFKNAGSDDPKRKAKHDESRVLVDLMDRAWKETDGGRVSPPRPW